jgi:predicted outer membrane lipoprotein
MNLRLPTATILGALIGGIVASPVGLLIVGEVAAMIVTALAGAIIGSAIAGGLIKTTGWAILGGGVLGGIGAVLIAHVAKAALLGIPIGCAFGVVVGLAWEFYRGKCGK